MKIKKLKKLKKQIKADKEFINEFQEKFNLKVGAFKIMLEKFQLVLGDTEIPCYELEAYKEHFSEWAKRRILKGYHKPFVLQKTVDSLNDMQIVEVEELTAGEMLQINITAFTNGKPLPYTKQQHTEAQGFSNEDAKCWNKYLPEAEQYIEIPDNYLFTAFGIANVPDVCPEQLEALHNKMEADKWTVKGKEIKNWRKELLPEIEKLDRVKHTIYTLPMHQTIQLPEIRKQVTRVAHGLIYEGTGVDSGLENSIYVPVKGEFYNVDYNYPDMINLIELEKQRIKNKGV